MTVYRSSSKRHPEAKRVGDHLVVDKSEWVPGADPDPHFRWDGQTTYREAYLRCIRCGTECVRESDFPERCDERAFET